MMLRNDIAESNKFLGSDNKTSYSGNLQTIK
jgi:hypothetical protein